MPFGSERTRKNSFLAQQYTNYLLQLSMKFNLI